MGCVCAGESDIEQYLTDFIDELRVRKYNDVNFLEFLKKNSPYGKPSDNYAEFLKAVNNEQTHLRYRNDLFARAQHLFYPSLIFLIHQNPEKMATNYKNILEEVKRSYKATQKTNNNFFEKNEYDALYDVLTFYVRMVSFDIVEASINSKDTRISEEQARVLKNNFSHIAIEIFVRDLMKDSDNPNIDLDHFFRRHFSILKHPSVRERLRKICENKEGLKKIPKKKQNLN